MKGLGITIGTQAKHWLFVYIVFPLMFVFLEFFVRFLVGFGVTPMADAFPFASLSVAIILITIFVCDEVSEYKILDASSDDNDEKRGHIYILFAHAIIMAIVMALMVALEVLFFQKKIYEFMIQLVVIRAFCVAVALSLIRQVAICQARFKLRAN